MTTLTDFLLARISDDEVVAGDSCYDAPFLARHGFGVGYDTQGADGRGDRYLTVDPARVLAECEAKRRIVNLMGYVRESWENKHSGVGRVMWPDVNRREKSHALTILENLALPYADHPDYRPEWRP